MRSNPLRSAATASCAVLAVLAAGCGSGAGGPKPAVNERPGRGGELTVLGPAPPAGLDPHRVVGVTDVMAHAVAFRQLYVHVPGKDAPVADLAAGPAEISDGGRTVTVPVKRTGRFGPEGGRRIVARDVEHGLERALADPIAGPRARRLLGTIDGLGPVGAWEDVLGITAVNDEELVIRLRRPAAAEVLEGLATSASTPIPSDLPRDPGALPADVPVYSGAYAPSGVLPAPLVRTALRLVRNPAWRPDSDPRPAYANAITFVPARRVAAAWRVLDGQGLVLAQPAPPEVARIARKRDSGQLAVAPLPITRYVALNPRAPALRDIHARRALVAGLDREALIDAAGGGGEVASHYLPPSVPGYDESGGVDGTGAAELREPSGDRRLAASDLRQAGMRGGRWHGPPLTAVRGDSGADAAVARQVRRSWRELGVRLRVRVLTGARLRAACADPSGAVAVCLSAAAGSREADPEEVLTPMVRGRTGAKVDEAVAASAELPDGPLRAKAWAGINRAAVDAAIGVPWRWDERPLLVSRDVIGAVDERAGTWDLAFTSLDRKARRGQSR